MENVLNSVARVSTEKNNVIQALILGILAFLIPTFLSGMIVGIFGETSVISNNSQFIVGSIVNILLITAAINVKGFKNIIGIVTMPSISTILSGYVFGTASTFMVYMIPAIWVGNFLLIYAYKFFMINKNMNVFLAGVIGVIFKVTVIFGFFELISLFGIFPSKVASMLQVAMGFNQLITASIAVVLVGTAEMVVSRKKIVKN